MQVTDRIRDKTKALQSISTPALTYSNTRTHQVFVTNSRTNTPFSRLSSSIMGTFTLTPQQSEKEQARLMKEGRYFSCKKKCHTVYDCPKKGIIAAISNSGSEDSDSQGKE